MNGVNCPYVFNFRPYDFFRYRFFPKFQTFNTKSEPSNTKILTFWIIFLDVSGDFLWFFRPNFLLFQSIFGNKTPCLMGGLFPSLGGVALCRRQWVGVVIHPVIPAQLE